MLWKVEVTSNKLIIVGAGGHAAACVEAIESQGKYKIEGFIGQAKEVGDVYLGYPVLGSDLDLINYVDSVPFALVAVGGISDSMKRVSLIRRNRDLGFQAPTIIAATAYVSSFASIGEGAVLMHGVVVNARANIGNHCIINSKSLIEHDVKIGHYSHVSTGVIINGGVSVGKASFIGSASVIREDVVIGGNCFVGMGQAIVDDVPEGGRKVK